MNEAAVVKFLAEKVLGWIEIPGSDRGMMDPKTTHIHWLKAFWGDRELSDIKLEGERKTETVADAKRVAGMFEIFAPIHRIEHAWMVEDAIAKMEGTVKERYIDELLCACRRALNDMDTLFLDAFEIVHATPKQRSIAAVRALATPEQIASWL